MTLEEVQQLQPPPYPDPKSVEECEEMENEYTPKIRQLEIEVSACHDRGDHAAGELLRHKLKTFAIHLYRFGATKAHFRQL